MIKIIPISKARIAALKDQWCSMDDELPPADIICAFYNKFLDVYKICTLDELENEFKGIRNNLADLPIETDDYIEYEIHHLFHPTHWRYWPFNPPID